MATPARKPFSGTTNSSPRRPLDSSPARPSSSASVPATTGQGLARSPSVRQSRPIRRSTARMSTSFTPDSDFDPEDDETTSSAQLISELKEQVQRAEQASEQYRKQLEVMQRRLDDSTNEQTLAEERDFQRQTQLDHLHAEVKDASRQRRELELAHESERRLLLQERERQTTKEAELQAVISRLNETLRNKGLERTHNNRIASMSLQSESTDGPQNSQNIDPATMDSHLYNLQEKDAIIEALRLEIADFHLNAAEQEHMGDGRLQLLERQVMEIKMQNARLQEENESFQMLLSEKTLKGDFLTEHRTEDTGGMSTLAEELESATDDPEMQMEALKKLEAELKAAKEENKGLTLYIDKIIGRILQHEGLEHVIVNNDDRAPSPPLKLASRMPVEKALPATPLSQEDDMTTPTSATTVSSAAQGFLKRAKSVVSRSGNPRPTRPISYAQPVPLTANENPETAPSIPLNRGHRRARSDQAQQDLGAAAVVQQMNRGSPLRTVSGGPISPGISPINTQLHGKTGYFPAPLPAVTRAPSGPGQGGGHGSSRNSITSDHSLERSSTDASSAPSNTAPIPGAVMKQNQLRPLRLVQEQSREEEEAQKRVNRGSWIGWLRGSAVEAQSDDRNIDR